MKLGIMQPYFLPYPGYFDLIDRCDRWVVFDTPQYIRHGWVNRNRTLHPSESWQYIGVPLVKHSRNTPIRDIRIKDEPWRERIRGQLEHYRTRAPYYSEVTSLLEKCFAIAEEHLSPLNTHALRCVCEHLGIEFNCSTFSTMDLALGPIDGPGDWALRISEAVGASEYINPPGGRELFDPEKFQSAGVRLTIQEYDHVQYDCPGYQFEPGLSIIDALMWLAPDEILSQLRQRRSTSNHSQAGESL